MTGSVLFLRTTFWSGRHWKDSFRRRYVASVMTDLAGLGYGLQALAHVHVVADDGVVEAFERGRADVAGHHFAGVDADAHLGLVGPAVGQHIVVACTAARAARAASTARSRWYSSRNTAMMASPINLSM